MAFSMRSWEGFHKNEKILPTLESFMFDDRNYLEGGFLDDDEDDEDNEDDDDDDDYDDDEALDERKGRV